MIGNTHFDPVWLWTWDEGLSSIRSTFRAALDRMDEDADFIYSFSCPPVFEQIEKVDPALMNRIRTRIAEGRWSLDEGLWVQPDCYSASLESYIRQCLYGQLYLKEHFGRISDTVFNIDSFGHPVMLPQIYQKAGMKYSVVSRPDEKDMDLEGHSLFRWIAPDGSDMLVCRANVNGDVYPRETEPSLRRMVEKLDQTDYDLMMVYGVTNHGGAPTRKALAAIHALNEETGGRVCFGNTGSYFRAQEGRKLPDWANEIPIRFFGVFINRPDVKKACRENEYALLNAERASLLAGMLTNAPDETEILTRNWKTLMYNQFHDILGGASLSDAYPHALRQMGGSHSAAEELMHLSLQRIARDIDLSNADCPDSAWSLVVCNLNTAPYRGYLTAEVQWAWEFDWYEGEICLTDEDGHDLPCQKVLPRSVIPGFRSRFVFYAEIPALGRRVFRVRQKSCSLPDEQRATAQDKTLSDGRIRVTIDEFGGISEIFDLQKQKIILRECARPVAVRDESDVWAFNFTGYGAEQPFHLDWARITENGPLRACIKLHATYDKSFVEQSIYVHLDSGAVEGKLRVDWNQHHETLNLCFKGGDCLKVATPGYGVQRAFDGRELPCGGWLDITHTDGSGALILTDCFHGFDTTSDGRVRGSVLRSPMVGDLRVREPMPDEEYEFMSQGVFEGRWRMVSHDPESEAFAWRELNAFLNAPVILDEANHPGTLPMRAEYLAGDQKDVLITALKRAEDRTGEMIVRLQNFADAERSFTAALAGLPRIQAMLASREILTLRLHDGRWHKVDLLEQTDTGTPLPS